MKWWIIKFDWCLLVKKFEARSPSQETWHSPNTRQQPFKHLKNCWLLTKNYYVVWTSFRDYSSTIPKIIKKYKMFQQSLCCHFIVQILLFKLIVLSLNKSVNIDVVEVNWFIFPKIFSRRLARLNPLYHFKIFKLHIL